MKTAAKTVMESNVEMMDGTTIGIRANSITPIFYHEFTGRDLLKDIADLQTKILSHIKSEEIAELEKMKPGDFIDSDAKKAQEKRQKAMDAFGAMDVEVFAGIAYTMANQYARAHDEEIAPTWRDWLDEIPGVFSIYNLIMPVFELWSRISQTTSTPKKKSGRRSANSTRRSTFSG